MAKTLSSRQRIRKEREEIRRAREKDIVRMSVFRRKVLYVIAAILIVVGTYLILV